MTLRLHVERCHRCDRRAEYVLFDARPWGMVFACPHCRHEVPLRLEQAILLVKRDRERLGLGVPRFLLEKLHAAGFDHVAAPTGIRLRLHLSGPWSCGCRQDFWLKDVYDSGPLFCCPEDPEHEWHLHLDQIRTFALADRLALGGPLPTHLLAGDPLLEPVDRRSDEARAALREEAVRRGYSPRELPWQRTARRG